MSNWQQKLPWKKLHLEGNLRNPDTQCAHCPVAASLFLMYLIKIFSEQLPWNGFGK